MHGCMPQQRKVGAQGKLPAVLHYCTVVRVCTITPPSGYSMHQTQVCNQWNKKRRAAFESSNPIVAVNVCIYTRFSSNIEQQKTTFN